MLFYNTYVLKYRFLLLNTIKMSYLVKFFYRFFFLKREKILFSCLSYKLRMQIFLISMYLYSFFSFCIDSTSINFFFLKRILKLFKIPFFGYMFFFFLKCYPHILNII